MLFTDRLSPNFSVGNVTCRTYLITLKDCLHLKKKLEYDYIILFIEGWISYALFEIVWNRKWKWGSEFEMIWRKNVEKVKMFGLR